MAADQHLITLEDYQAHLGARAVDGLKAKARRLAGLHVINVNSTYYSGGGFGLDTGVRINPPLPGADEELLRGITTTL